MLGVLGYFAFFEVSLGCFRIGCVGLCYVLIGWVGFVDVGLS